MSVEPGPLQPGQRFAGCRVLKPLARGALGVLDAEVDEASGEGRALKLIAPLPGTDAQAAREAAQRFAQAAAAATRLRHPDIVRVHGAGTEGGRAYLVMDLLGGCDLSRYTQRARLLPEPVALRVAERMARALAHAHAHGVVHRDLKPANVMVDWAADRVTLTDFGLARLADAERTRTGLVLGSPSYMAPELLAGQAADARSDLYALGVLLFLLLAGELPFDAPSLGELLRQVAGEPAPDLRQRRPGGATAATGATGAAPAAMDAVAELVAQLLHKQPARRLADGGALADALAAAAARLGPAGAA